MRASRLGNAACATLVAVTGALVLPPAPAAAACTTGTAPLSVEEQRLESQPVPGQILARSGFDARVTAFADSLCATTSSTQATQVVTTHAGQLWEAAVDRAQGGPPGGDQLAADDDRPLYWARLGMTRALRRWVPTYPLSAEQRAALERTLELASRGITSSTFDGSAGRRLFVTGFDPFLLDDEIRRGNPSGAAALTLDGQVLTVNGVRIQVQTVVFPVRYADFDRGIVEDAIGPHVAAGAQRADAITTVSQGRAQFDLEVFNGRRRSATIGDNNNVQGGGTFTAPVAFPGVGPGPEFVRTSLPLDAMQAVGADPFPINVNPSVWEIPAGGTGPQFRPDGPTAGSVAVEGSGGGYLSNEVAYRNTLLLAGTAGAPAGGHVHTPTLGSPANPADITDPGFEQQRSAIVGQTRAIVARAVT
jgi:pyrrolidone-carboxylate peptidase